MQMMRQLLGGRMYPLTLEGLDRAMRDSCGMHAPRTSFAIFFTCIRKRNGRARLAFALSALAASVIAKRISSKKNSATKHCDKRKPREK